MTRKQMAKKFELTTVRCADGRYMTSDKKVFVYGMGDTASDSLARYKVNLVDYCALLKDTIRLDKQRVALVSKCLKKWKF